MIDTDAYAHVYTEEETSLNRWDVFGIFYSGVGIGILLSLLLNKNVLSGIIPASYQLILGFFMLVAGIVITYLSEKGVI